MAQQGALGRINQRNKEARNQSAPPSPIPSGGLNQLMNQKVDAYSSNPQALEKRYQQNQQLIDLLALQKIKTDKTTAANNIALQMQQNPSTIAQQREQEVLAMTKNEMAQQTAGILGQRQKQQQKNMQRTAKGQNVAPQGGAMMAARGGLMPLPRPTMQKMASGGILGYKAGTEVISDEGSRLERSLKALGITYKDYMALSPTDKEDLQPKLNQEYAKQKKEFTPEFGAIGPILQSMDEVKERTKALIASGLTPEEATSEERRRRLNPTDAEKQSSASASVTSVDSNKSMSGLPSLGKRTKELQKMQGPDPEQKPGVGVLAPGQVAVPGQGVLKPPVVPPAGPTPPSPPAATGIAAELPLVKPVDPSTLQQDRVSSRLDPAVKSVLQENMLADPTALGKTARTEQDEFANRKEFFDKRQENIAGIAALNKQDFDPDKLAKQRRLAALAPYNASVRGMLQADNAVESTRYNRALVELRLDDASMKEDSAAAAKSGEIGQKMFDSITSARSTAAKAYASLSVADQTAVDAEARRILDADKGNLSAKIKQLEIESTNALRMAIQGSQTLGQLQQRYREIIEIKDKAVKTINDNLDVSTREALRRIKAGDGTDEDIVLQKKYDSIIANIMSEKYARYEEYILAEIGKVSGVPFPKANNSVGGGAGGGGISAPFDPNP